MHIALSCVKIVDFLSFRLYRDSNPRPPYNGQGNLAAISPIRTVSLPPQSEPPFVQKDRNIEINIHVPPTRVKGRHRCLPKRIEAIHGGYQSTKFAPNTFIGLASTLGCKFFARVCAIARGTCHLQPISLNRYHCLSAVTAHRMNVRPSRSDKPFVLPIQKCLDRRTHIQTDRQTPARLLYISDPPEEIFEHKGSNANALEPLDYTILN